LTGLVVVVGVCWVGGFVCGRVLLCVCVCVVISSNGSFTPVKDSLAHIK